MIYQLAQMDAVEYLNSLAADSIDLIITDPPYESLEVHRKRGTTTRLKHSKSSHNDWFAIFPNQRFDALFAACYRVLKADRHFYLFCDHKTMMEAVPRAQAVGFTYWKPLVWDKQHQGLGYHYRCQYEFILFFEKGKRKLNHLEVPDVLSFMRVHRQYPTEKPMALMEVLIDQSTNPLEVVCDPFMGSASVGAAAVHMNRVFWGNDLADSACVWAKNRLEQMTNNSQLSFFSTQPDLPKL